MPTLRRAGRATLLALALAPGSGSAAPPAPATATGGMLPQVYQMALPARVAYVAFIAADKVADAFDLDLRVEVVLPMRCGDTYAGLLRTEGASDQYAVLIGRRSGAPCVKEGTRLGARSALRLRIADGQTRELTLGSTVLKVARKGRELTIDGAGPEGDVPGAPPTARPEALVAGEVLGAKLLAAAREVADPEVVRVRLAVQAKWPPCAAPPVAMMGSGDASTGFALTRFAPVAQVPQDQPCSGKSAARTSELETVLRVPRAADKAAITVGQSRIEVALGTAAGTAAPAAPAAR